MTQKLTRSDSLLNTYVDRVNRGILGNLAMIGPESPVRDMCAYALSTGGKRLRPVITLMMADALENQADVTLSALSVEYFHTASLVADDMPSMDDDDERRNLPSVHKKFGEAAALLVSYALIGAGYDMIAQNANFLLKNQVSFSDSVDLRCRFALENASFNTGLNGATGGQFLDIKPPDLSVETIKKVIHLKTSSLFEIAFVYGWLFGGGSLDKLPAVKKVAAHFGLAFQVADDLGDQEQDRINQRAVNMANILGREKAIEMFHGEHEAFLHTISQLDIDATNFIAIAESVKSSI